MKHETKTETCPNCGAVANFAEDVSNRRAPMPGDYTICPHCCNMNVFDEQMHRRKLTTEELAALPPDAHEFLRGLKQIGDWFDKNEPPGKN